MDKAMKEKFGVTGEAMPAERVLVMPLEHFHNQGIPAYALIVICNGFYTAVNAYTHSDGGFKAGKKFDPIHYTYEVSDKARKKWKKKGYEEGRVEDWDILQPVSE